MTNHERIETLIALGLTPAQRRRYLQAVEDREAQR